MAGGIDWFRWHHGTVDEAKLRTAARRAGARVCEAVAMWAICMETASKAENRGSCAGLDFEVIDCTQEFEEGTAERLYRAFQGLTRPLVDSDESLAAWDKRQPKREREDNNVAERKRNQRARDAASTSQEQPDDTSSCHVTPCHATSHQKTPRGEKSREEEKREEGSLSGKIVGAADAATPPAQKATRLADGWQLPKAWGEWALTEYPHWTADVVRLEAQKFADHFRALPGKDGRKTDWPATWRNWCRNDICQRSHPLPNAGRTAKPGRMTEDERAAFNAAEAEKAKHLLFGSTTASADVIENELCGVAHEAG